jgi:hypothetical protein
VLPLAGVSSEKLGYFNTWTVTLADVVSGVGSESVADTVMVCVPAES